MKTKTKNLVFLLIIGLVFPFLLNFNFNLNSEDNTSSINPKSSGDCSGSILQASIYIDGFATGMGAHNWTWAESQSWCSGAGTWSNPYIIESLTIDGLGLTIGIQIRNSNAFFIIQGCTILNCVIGIYLNNVNNSRLIENNCSLNENAIMVLNSNNNTISGNTVNGGNSPMGGGINIHTNCRYNNITGNTVNNHVNSYGIQLYDRCNFNKILGNSIKNNNWGIILSIYIESLDHNDFTENIIYHNTIGIYLDSGCINNSFYKNFFLQNGKHTVDDGTDNTWNSTTLGNYWDNHTGPDANSDGIVDNPYAYIGGSAGSIDYLPMAEDGAPNITIITPSEGDSFASVAPSFEIEVVDIYVWEMWYTIDGGLHNYTFTENEMINQSAWDALPEGSVAITFFAIDIVGNEASEEVTVIKSIPAGGLDPGIIITIIIVSVVGGVAVISVVYIFMKKRATLA
ncbi:MAG: hypothetical protein CEE43_15355 [Promethearchaeota archaeon Loki_b32]|nr:MAG: hypothetical protein CEE43_15355 [Candidatus Lokiarchaeota archaeon Loki_b32]